LPDNPEFLRLTNELRASEIAAAAIKTRVEQTKAELQALTRTIEEAPGVAAELLRMTRDYEQTQKNYEELIDRRNRLALTTSLGAGGQGVDYRVFEEPVAALRPASPPRALLILAALAAALGVGAGAALTLTHLDRSFTQAQDLAPFGRPVLGSISLAPSEFARRASAKDAARLAAAGAALGLAALAYIYLAVFRLPADAGGVGAGHASRAEIGEALRWG
jgi:hypothetical protein